MEWIKLIDKHPPLGERVLTACKGSNIVTIEYTFDDPDVGLIWLSDNEESSGVPFDYNDYWMPLPIAPIE